MSVFSDWNRVTKEPLANSSLEDWSSYLENFPGEPTPPLSRVSRLELIILSLHTLPGLIVISILWVVLVLGLVFASILLISWEMPARASTVSSMAVLPLESDWDTWIARRPFCCQLLHYEDSMNTLLVGRFSLKFETLEEVETWNL